MKKNTRLFLWVRIINRFGSEVSLAVDVHQGTWLIYLAYDEWRQSVQAARQVRNLLIFRGNYITLGTDTCRLIVYNDTDASRHEYFPTLFRRLFRQLWSGTAQFSWFAGSAA
jgi:hypothetical protein